MLFYIAFERVNGAKIEKSEANKNTVIFYMGIERQPSIFSFTNSYIYLVMPNVFKHEE